MKLHNIMFRKLVLALLVFAATTNGLPLNGNDDFKIPFAFEDVVPSSFYFPSFNGSWFSENHIIYRHLGDMVTYNVQTNDIELFLNQTVLNQWQQPTWTFSSDNRKMLIRYDVTSIFRHSIVASYAIYNIDTGVVIDIANKAKINLCVWSPNGNDVLYVQSNDVYFVRNLAALTPIRLTTDGVDGVIYNGVPDWVYEEEVFGSGGAMWLSPDGSKLAIASFNDTEVKDFVYNLYDEQYETEVKLRYPKVGHTNPTVALRYVSLTQEPYVWQSVAAPLEKVTTDHVLQTVQWVTNNQLSALWLNRRQNVGVLQLCDSNTNLCAEPLDFAEPNGWIDVSNAQCTSTGSECFFIDYSGDWRNIFRYNVLSGTKAVIYPAAVTVLSIFGYKESTQEIFYLATTEQNPEYRHVYRNGVCLTCTLTGPENIPCTYASASFSKDYSHYAVTCNGPRPAYSKVFRSSDNVELKVWQDNVESLEDLAGYQLPRAHYLRVPVPGGYEAAVKLLLPPEIDPLATDFAQQYAMVVDVYGGPNSVRVVDTFSVGYKDFLITSRKVVYAYIDGRGSGNKGKNMLFTLNNKLGTVEIEDQILVAKYLQEHFKFIDAKRTAIWGWSYGGYATAMALADDKENVFQCGISVAPVTSWIYYDSIYTERYMGLPTIEDNLSGYNVSDVNRRVQDMRKHQFLLIHGNADDNVHFQQAMVLSRALVNADIQFDQVSYPNEAHSLSGVSQHLYHTIDQFWVKCLHL